MAKYGTTDRFTAGGTITEDLLHEGAYVPANAVDNNTGTHWYSNVSACPHWLKYDFGAGVTWAISKVTLQCVDGRGGNAFTVNGSNNDSTYTQLYSGNRIDNNSVQTFTFVNRVKYRYIKIIFTSSYYGNGQVNVTEMEAFEGIYWGGSFLFNLT